MGSLVGFVVLKLPQYFLQRARKLARIIVVLKNYPSISWQHARKLAQNLIDSDSDYLMRPPDMPSPPPFPSQSAAISSRLHSTLSPCVVHRPLSSLVVAPPSSHRVASSLALVLVVSIVGRRGQRDRRIHRRRAGSGGRSNPSSSSSVATTTLRVARPPPSSRAVQHLLS